jgi:hypothetical protein
MRLHAAGPGVTSLFVLWLAAASACAATPKACDLFTAQTATALAGEAVGAPKDIEGKGCSYTTKSGALIGLSVADMSPDDAKNYMVAMMSMVKSPATTESIPGLGEQNFLLVRPESQKNKNALLVIYHKKSLTLGVQRKMTPDLKAAMAQAMRQILSKI